MHTFHLPGVGFAQELVVVCLDLGIVAAAGAAGAAATGTHPLCLFLGRGAFRCLSECGKGRLKKGTSRMNDSNRVR